MTDSRQPEATTPSGFFVGLIKINDIEIAPNRQRREFDEEALMELSESIRNNGLLHPIVVRRESGRVILAAGERRLRAIVTMLDLGGSLKFNSQTIEDGYVPFNDAGNLSTLEAEELELEENTIRRDLSWQELADAQARLHELRKKQATAKGTIHTIADTAKEVQGRSDGYFREKTVRALVVAQHLDKPEIAKAKSLDDAFKIIQKQETAAKNTALATEVGKTYSSSVHKLENVDCCAFMQGQVGVYDVILSDPPYGMGADSFGDAGGSLVGLTHEYKDDYETWKALMERFVPLTFQVTKAEAHTYLFCDIERFSELKSMMEDAGWKVHRTPLIFHKPNAQRVPWPDQGPRRHWEAILYAVKGNKKTNFIAPDVISASKDEALDHAAQKPVDLYADLLSRSVRAGDKVIDPFCGSGPIFPAAQKLKVAATGCEMSPSSYGIALKRLQELAPQPTLI